MAGEVWGLLAESDGQTLAAIKKSIDAPPDVVVAALGWLAREDKLEFIASGRTREVVHEVIVGSNLKTRVRVEHGIGIAAFSGAGFLRDIVFPSR